VRGERKKKKLRLRELKGGGKCIWLVDLEIRM
jgi:hypothetical protein